MSKKTKLKILEALQEYYKCKYCKSFDIYETNLRKGFHYRCNNCGEYLK